MAEGIKKSDLIVGDPLDEIRLDLDKVSISLEKNDDLFRSIAKTLKNDISPQLEKTSKGIRAINEAEIASEKLLRDKLANEKKLNDVKIAQEKLAQAELRTKKILNDTDKKQQQTRLQEIRTQKAREKAVDDYTKKELASKKKIERARLEEIRLQQAREKAVDDFSKKEAAANKRAVSESVKNRKETLALNDAYKILARRYNNAQSRLKRLTLQYGEHDKRTIKARKHLKNLEQAYRKVNNAAKDSKPFIGEYERGIGKLRTSLLRTASALGLVGGGFAIFSKIKNTIVGFDQSMQNLAAITNESTVALEAQSRQLGGSTVFTASEAADAMTMLAMAGYNTNQILASTPAVLSLASAGQLELAEAADIASNVLSGFGLSANETARVVDVIAKTATSTNTTVQTLGESFKEIAPTANNLKIPIEEVAAAVGLLGNSGIKGTDATTTLNSALNRLAKPTKEMSSKMQQLNVDFFDANGQFIGITETVDMLNKAMVGLTDEQKANAISTIFGARANKQMTSLLLGQTTAMIDGKEQTLKGADALRSLTAEYENAEGAAAKMAEIQEDSVAGAYKLLNSAIEEYILGTNDAVGFSDKLKEAMKFLAENINVILGTIGKLIKAFVTYKTVLFALKMKDRISEWVSFRKAVKSGAKGMNDASKEAKGFGRNMKAIGWTALIGLALELANAFIDIANGADVAARETERFNDINERSTEVTNENIKAIRGQIDAENDRLALLVSTGNITEAQANERLKAFIEEERFLGTLSASYKDFGATAKDVYGGFFTEVDQLIKEQERSMSSAELTIKSLERTSKFKNRLLIADEKANIENAKEQIKLLKEFKLELQSEQFQRQIAANENAKHSKFSRDATKGEIKDVKDLKKGYEDLTDAINAAGEAENERLQLIEGFNISESEKNTQRAIDAANKIATETGVIEDGRIENALKREEELKRAQIERIFSVRVEESENAEQVELAMEQRNQALFLLDEEFYNKKKEAIKNLNELQESYAESLKNEVTTVEDNNEEIYNAYKNLQEALTDVLNEQIDARINLLDKEKDAAKSRQDYYEALAANGNITAEKSITKQIELQREAEQEQARLAKIKQNIEMISAGLKTFTAAIEQGDSPAEALATTLTTTQVLASILGNLNFFEKGTNNAPEGWAVVDEKGAEIHTDKHGNIKDFGSDKGARWKYLDAGDKIVTANKSAALINKFDQIGMSEIASKTKDHAGNSYDLMALQNELKGMRGDMSKLQTKIEVDWQGLAGGMARVNVHTTKGGDKRTERYTIR